jgi:hypothetical protein
MTIAKFTAIAIQLAIAIMYLPTDISAAIDFNKNYSLTLILNISLKDYNCIRFCKGGRFGVGAGDFVSLSFFVDRVAL